MRRCWQAGVRSSPCRVCRSDARWHAGCGGMGRASSRSTWRPARVRTPRRPSAMPRARSAAPTSSCMPAPRLPHWRRARSRRCPARNGSPPCIAACSRACTSCRASIASSTRRAGRRCSSGPSVALVGAAGLVPLITLAEAQRTLVKSAARQWGRHGMRLNWVGVGGAALRGRAGRGRAAADAGARSAAAGARPRARGGSRGGRRDRLARQRRCARRDRRELQPRRRRLDGAMSRATANCDNDQPARACWTAASPSSPAPAAASAAASRWRSPPPARAWR